MARPRKPRLVTEDAPATYFKPQGIPLVDLPELVLTLDGLEALRHVDVDGLDQAAAAERMGVSRSTLSRILAEARKTLATAIARGLALRIEGGAIARPCASPCRHMPRSLASADDGNGAGTDEAGNAAASAGRAPDIAQNRKVKV